MGFQGVLTSRGDQTIRGDKTDFNQALGPNLVLNGGFVSPHSFHGGQGTPVSCQEWKVDRSYFVQRTAFQDPASFPDCGPRSTYAAILKDVDNQCPGIKLDVK